MTGHFISPVPNIDYARFTAASTKKEAVKSMVRVDDTVLVEKATGELVVLYQHNTKSFNKASYTCSVWRGVEKIFKCMLALGRINKTELQKHVDAANANQRKELIKYDIESIDRFREEFELTDAQYAKLVAKAEKGLFINQTELYRI